MPVELESDDLLPIRFVARKLGVSDRSVRRYIEAGLLQGTRIGGVWRVERQALASFILAGRTETKEDT